MSVACRKSLHAGRISPGDLTVQSRIDVNDVRKKPGAIPCKRETTRVGRNTYIDVGPEQANKKHAM